MAARRVYVAARDAAARPGVRYVDARWSLGDLALGRRQYLESRVPGAVFFDLEALSGEVTPATGRHPLPPWERWAAWLRSSDLRVDDDIVAYDGAGGAMGACRVWWMLTVSGFPNARVLAGGFPQWEADALPVDSTPLAPADVDRPRAPRDAAYPDPPCRGWDPSTVVDIDVVRRFAKGNAGATRLVDCRSAARWGSTTEPVGPDPKPGNVPGSVNHPFSDNYVAVPGLPKEPEAVRELCVASAGADTADNTILMCGSGVTACCTAAAYVEGGLGLPRIYVGSWSEWCNKGEA